MQRIVTSLSARILRHDARLGMTTVHFADGELRVPQVSLPEGAGVRIDIDARDVSIALSRPMDVSITNRLPGRVVVIEQLTLPYVAVTLDLGASQLKSLITLESLERLALEDGLRAWAMVKAVAIAPADISLEELPPPRPFGRPSQV
jgi:molybdate transport system ATP-binding protein